MRKYMFCLALIGMAISATFPASASQPDENYPGMDKVAPTTRKQLTQEIEKLESDIQKLERLADLEASHGAFGASGECFVEARAKQRQLDDMKKLLSEMSN